MSDALRSLKTNQQLWANRSGHSRQMSHYEQIAQVAHDKWAIMSNSLRLLMINEQMSDLLKNCWLKKSKLLIFTLFYIVFFGSKNEWFAHSLIFGERCERIAQVAHQKWEMWANCSVHSPKMSDHERFAQVAHHKWATMSESLRSLTRNEQMSELLVLMSESLICPFFLQKTSNLLRKLMSNFPALIKTHTGASQDILIHS